MKFSYDPGDDEPKEIGVTWPILDLHGRPLVGPRTVSVDDPLAERRFKRGVTFHIDEKLEPVMHAFFKSHRRFRNLNHGDNDG
jgi:hypothetical protein